MVNFLELDKYNYLNIKEIHIYIKLHEQKYKVLE